MGKLLACIKVAGQTAFLGNTEGHRWGHDVRGHGDTAKVTAEVHKNQFSDASIGWKATPVVHVMA